MTEILYPLSLIACLLGSLSFTLGFFFGYRKAYIEQSTLKIGKVGKDK